MVMEKIRLEEKCQLSCKTFAFTRKNVAFPRETLRLLAKNSGNTKHLRENTKALTNTMSFFPLQNVP